MCIRDRWGRAAQLSDILYNGIPFFVGVSPVSYTHLFGLSICLMNGQTINIGDTDYRFGIESVSKVHTAILILRQYGAQKVDVYKRQG